MVKSFVVARLMLRHVFAKATCAGCDLFNQTARLVKQHEPDAGFEKPLESEATSVANGMVE